jgi:hypothetical protein
MFSPSSGAASAARKRKDAELPCAAIERRRAELAENREQLIKKWRAMVVLHNAQNDSGRVQ